MVLITLDWSAETGVDLKITEIFLGRGLAADYPFDSLIPNPHIKHLGNKNEVGRCLVIGLRHGLHSLHYHGPKTINIIDTRLLGNKHTKLEIRKIRAL